MYKKGDCFSYALGSTTSIELLKNSRDKFVNLYYNEKTSIDLLQKICKEYNINESELQLNKKIFNSLSKKENFFIISKFKKYIRNLDYHSRIHIILDKPSNAGNLGTIIRSAIGFGISDIAVIGDESVDIFDPKVIRASIGAFFSCNIQSFQNIQEYINTYNDRTLYSFYLDSKNDLRKEKFFEEKSSFIFGNEATGLGEEYRNLGKTLRIFHSKMIDSLNLQTAVSISLYEYTRRN